VRLQPNPEDKAAWSAVGAATFTAGVAGALAWLALADPSSGREPGWPVVAFGVLALAGFYVMLAPLLRWAPWPRKAAVIPSSSPGNEPSPEVPASAPAPPIEHQPIRWDDLGTRPVAGEETVALEPWLRERIATYERLSQQRPIRGERWWLGAMHQWDVRNTHELLTVVAPELVDGYRGDPPGHRRGEEEPYYRRQLAWLRSTLDRLLASVAEAPEDPAAVRERPGGSLALAAIKDTSSLVDLYEEGERLRAWLLTSSAFLPGDLLRGAARKRQVERERVARDWDRRVHDALPEAARARWSEAGTLAAHPLDHVSTITGVREFIADKLKCLREIVSIEPEADAAELHARVPAGE